MAIINVGGGGGGGGNAITELLNRTITVIDDPGVLGVYQYAFQSCTQLVAARMANASFIETAAFNGCTSLQTIDFPSCTSLMSNTFSGCANLKKVKFDQLSSIISSTFSGVNAVTELYLPKCKNIGTNNLGLSYLQRLTIGAPTTFSNSANFPSLIYASTVGGFSTWSCPLLKELHTMPYAGESFISTQYVTSYSYSSYPALESIYFHGVEYFYSVFSSSTSAFHLSIGKSTVNYISLPSLKTTRVAHGTLNTGRLMFKYDILSDISLPECTEIYYGAFESCPNLQNIYAPKCEYIESYAFRGTKLSSASFPLCSFIGINVFREISVLSQISIPLCENIGSSAFYQCSALAEISLPVCLAIGNSAFYLCKSLMSVYMFSTVTPTITQNATTVFGATPIVNSTYTGSFGSVYVPIALLDQYKAAQYWSTISDRFVGLTSEQIAALSA